VSKTPAAAPRSLAESDDRTVFDCGRDSMNAWFNHSNDLSDAASGRIIG
jgi:hypothetical protein